jgi:purine-cytosine permease-like protein
MSKKELAKEVYFNLLPTTAEERPYGFIDFLAVQIAFGIAAWFFLVGGFTGLWVKASQAIPIVLFGNVFPLLLASPLAVIFARYGSEQYIGHRAVMGQRFSDIWFIIYVTSSVGWVAYAALLMGSGTWKLLASLGVSGIFATEQPGAVLWAIIGTVIGGWWAWYGPGFVKWAMKIMSTFLLIVLVILICLLFSVYGVEKIFATPPPQPFENPAWSIASAIEINVGLGFSWAFWYGQWARLAKTERAAYHGCYFGWGLLACTAGVFSALTALIVGSFDPTDWLLAYNVPWVTILGLLLIVIANVSSLVCLIYPLSLTTRCRFPRIRWTYPVIAFTGAGILMELIPGVYESYSKYLAIISLLTGVYAGIIVADYAITRGTYKLRAMYDRERGYRYWRGFNLSAVIATVVATIFYLTTLEPISWTSMNGLFPYTTAGIPAYFIAFITYYVLTKTKVFDKFYAPILLPPSNARKQA